MEPLAHMRTLDLLINIKTGSNTWTNECIWSTGSIEIEFRNFEIKNFFERYYLSNKTIALHGTNGATRSNKMSVDLLRPLNPMLSDGPIG